ncbi:hypothetical protein [Microbulbifer hydrolyticus]|uniref:AraC family transcriptional regulator n=1 Tax=Microbulbifer hydrolyticus TaxID=48074 RepID=A0A6P1TFJ8_9GAMM|nr:hypothetical protein [Microbulbifer hydrolyticus]MBB5212381.1 hypothetical protein [Microbulbifer hydrolyticus]QHQ40019.1 hypothetical protein GTQ55_14195 [Microbulbifer hydrolyticus]
MSRILIALATAWLLSLSVLASAQNVSREEIRGLDEQIQDVKKDVISLTSELNRLEEKLLFPSNTQAAFFISLADGASGEEFSLESVEVKLGNQVVAHHLYTYREIEALQQGGVQRIHTANVQTGAHPLVVSYLGKSKSGKEYRGTASYSVDKAVGPKFVEIQIAGTQSAINFKDW